MEPTDSNCFAEGKAEEESPTLPPRVHIIGVPITATNIEQCTTLLREHIEFTRGKYICVSNVHTTVMARESPSYLEVQTNSLLSIPDGKPLSVIGRKTYPAMDRVTGPKLMKTLFDTSAVDGFRHYFYGGTRATVDQLVNALHHDFPKLSVAGFEPSVFRELTDKEVSELANRIDESKADLVWIGLGAPRQEVLCARLKSKTNALMVGVGGAFNILAGFTPDAPEWMQKFGLEWLYRLVQEPRRLFKRYLVTNTKFISYLLIDKLRKHDDA